jgi:hypothetical protein
LLGLEKISSETRRKDSFIFSARYASDSFIFSGSQALDSFIFSGNTLDRWGEDYRGQMATGCRDCPSLPWHELPRTAHQSHYDDAKFKIAWGVKLVRGNVGFENSILTLPVATTTPRRL